MQKIKIVKTLFINLLVIILITTGTTLFKNASAQNRNGIIELRGKLLGNDKKPVQYAHIINLKKGLATISDTSGNFRMVMLNTDTLRISCLGYQVKYFTIGNLAENTNELQVTIYLADQVYDLAVVNIYKERWNSFLYDYANLKSKEKEISDQVDKWMSNMIELEELVLLSVAAQGVGFPINYTSKRSKSIAKMNDLIKQDELNKLADQKFNKNVVKDITKLEGEDLNKFMSYCKLDRDFIIKTTEYDLIVIINEIFSIYKKEHKNK